MAKFKVGDKVSHPADQNGAFAAGTGTVTTVTTGPPVTYNVTCDKTGQVLSCAFKENELSLA